MARSLARTRERLGGVGRRLRGALRWLGRRWSAAERQLLNEIDGSSFDRQVASFAACLFVAGGLLTSLTLLFVPKEQHDERVAVASVAMVAVCVGLIVWRLPWQYWPVHASAWLIVPAMALIAVGNHFNANPYDFSIYFVGAFMLLGVGFPRGTALRFIPLLVVAYILPLLTAGTMTADALSGGISTVGICLVIGELTAWLSGRLRRSEAKLQERDSESRVRALIQSSSDLVIVVAGDGTIRYLAPSIETLLGQPPDQLIGAPIGLLLPPAEVTSVARALARLAERPDQRQHAIWQMRHADGSWRQVEIIATNMLTTPQIEGIVLNGRDVTDHQALAQQLRRQAFSDPLTGLANRARLLDQLAQALGQVELTGQPVGILFLDIDDFKTINDSLGHAAGDQALLVVAGRLRGCLRAEDLIARLGGDEFAILLGAVDGPSAALSSAERIINQLREPFQLDETTIVTSTSIGIVLSSPRHGQPGDLLRDADIAMYMAKRQGKNRAALFDPAMHAAVTERLSLEADLRRALDEQEFVVHYQPLIDLTSGAIVSFEALVRWQHPTRGLLAPSVFIPVAEETGQIAALGRFVLTSACQQLSQWQRLPGQRAIGLSVNVSPRQFQGDSLIDDVTEALRWAGLTPASLILEITETVLVRDVAVTLSKLHALKGLGVQLAIDDFGTGSSSLSYLMQFPVDFIKIAKVFIDEIDQSAGSASLAAVVAQIGHVLGLETIAEGIERLEQIEPLRRLGCRLGQGYVFSRPVDALTMAGLLSTGRRPAGQWPATATGTTDRNGAADASPAVPRSRSIVHRPGPPPRPVQSRPAS